MMTTNAKARKKINQEKILQAVAEALIGHK
jgi:hypothetical protein